MSGTPGKKRGIRPSPHGTDLTEDFPKNDSRFLTRRDGMEYLEGVVPGDGGNGSFVHASETHALKPLAELFELQPAQIHSRASWGHWNDNNPIRLESIDQSAANPQATPRTIPLLESLDSVMPRKAFRNDPNKRLGTKTWGQHCEDLWDLLQAMRSKKWAANYHLMPLLQIAAYGMGDAVAVAVDALSVTKTVFRNKTFKYKGSKHVLAAGAERVECGNLTFGFSSPTELKKAMFNKRFFIGLVNFENNHWTSFIFDRKRRHLYHYDTLEAARQSRFRAAGLAFREAFSSAGLPYTFSMFGLPVTPQPDEWECGYLAVYTLFQNLRGLVGLDGRELRHMWAPTLVTFDQTKERAPTPFSLRHRDWTPNPWEKPSPSDLERVKDFITIAILGELGIKDLTFTESQKPIDFGSNNDREVRYSSGANKIGVKFLYTDLGGLQFICWKQRPYAHNHLHHRIVLPPTQDDHFYRRTLDIPQLPVFFVTLPDQLIERYKSYGYTVNDNATPMKDVIPDQVNVLSGTANDKEKGSPAQKTDAEKVALMKEKLLKMPTLPLGMQSLAQRQSLVDIISEVSMTDLMRLGEEVGIAPSPSMRQDEDGKQADFKKWLEEGEKASAPSQMHAAQQPMRRSSRLNPNLGKEPSLSARSSPLTSLADLETPSPWGSVMSLDVKGIKDMPFIQGAQRLSMEDDKVTDSRESFDRMPLSAGALRMTREARGRLDLPTVPDRVTQYLPTSDTWASYVPYGMVAESQWVDVVREVTGGITRDEVDQTQSRAKRMEERNKRRE